MLAAHHAGVREAVAYLDEHVGTRRGHAGVEARPQQGLYELVRERGKLIRLPWLCR
jgi:hypothetical protein